MDLNHARLPIPPLRHKEGPAGCWTAAVASLAKAVGKVKPCRQSDVRTGTGFMPVDCTDTATVDTRTSRTTETACTRELHTHMAECRRTHMAHEEEEPRGMTETG